MVANHSIGTSPLAKRALRDGGGCPSTLLRAQSSIRSAHSYRIAPEEPRDGVTREGRIGERSEMTCFRHSARERAEPGGVCEKLLPRRVTVLSVGLSKRSETAYPALAVTTDKKSTQSELGPSVLFSLDAFRAAKEAPPKQRNDHSFVATLDTLGITANPSGTGFVPGTPDQYRGVVRDALNHDLHVWRARRSKAYRGWFLPHVLEPTLLGFIVSLYFLLPQLGLAGPVRERLETILSIAGAVLGAVVIAHRLIQDPDGKKRGYIGRLDRMIAMTDGFKAQLEMEDSPDYEKVEFVRRSVKIAHSVLRPDEMDL